MSGSTRTPPKYNPVLVERAVLEVVIELHPEHLTVDELSLKIVADPEDGLEVETAIHAIHDLRRSDLVRYREDDRLVGPTYTALHAYAIFIG